jgi:hypothetical protein
MVEINIRRRTAGKRGCARYDQSRDLNCREILLQVIPDRTVSRGEIMEDIRKRLSDINRAIDRRDWAEGATAAVGSLIVLSIAWLTRDPWIRAGSLILAASALGILVVLYWTRRNRRGLRRDLTFEEYCRLNREALDGQIRLIRRVLWWYIAPISIGLNLFVVGLHHARETLVVHIALNVLFAAVIYAMNRRTVYQELVPLRERLNQCLADLGSK